MYFLEITTLVARGFIYFLALYFLFILLASEKKYKSQAVIVLIYCLIGSLIPDIDKSNPNYNSIWIHQCWLAVLINGAAALSVLASKLFSKNNIRLCLVFLFAAFINGVMVTLLENKATTIIPFIRFIYPYYGYLVLLTYIMMIGTSYDGFIDGVNNTFRRLQRYLCSDNVCHNSFSKNRFEKEDYTQGRRS